MRNHARHIRKRCTDGVPGGVMLDFIASVSNRVSYCVNDTVSINSALSVPLGRGGSGILISQVSPLGNSL